VVQFRKWVFLAHDDAVAHLHLGLALEAAGDGPSAQRAFGAARRALQIADPSSLELAIGGFAPSELLRLLDAKQEVHSP
jgi:chemotaxis protein methyltransferase CheR